MPPLDTAPTSPPIGPPVPPFAPPMLFTHSYRLVVAACVGSFLGSCIVYALVSCLLSNLFCSSNCNSKRLKQIICWVCFFGVFAVSLVASYMYIDTITAWDAESGYISLSFFDNLVAVLTEAPSKDWVNEDWFFRVVSPWLVVLIGVTSCCFATCYFVAFACHSSNNARAATGPGCRYVSLPPETPVDCGDTATPAPATAAPATPELSSGIRNVSPTQPSGVDRNAEGQGAKIAAPPRIPGSASMSRVDRVVSSNMARKR